ncbi:MAG: glycosylase [Planctomycetales bacterium 71-10]|nr:MAG: glycosylase [Planctomycetales bacterium 71-10]
MRKAWRWMPVAIVLVAAMGAEGRAFDEPWAFARWKPVGDGPVFAGTGGGSWDGRLRERGFILPEGDGYTLWYTGYERDKPLRMSLGRAVSGDGADWRRDERNPVFRDAWAEDVFVARVDGGYQMFAEGRGDIVHRLTSADGVRWADHGSLDVRNADGSPIEPGSFGTPTAWFEGGVWHLFYERGDMGVWLATSRDLKVWTNVRDEPVLARGPEPFDRAQIALNQVVRRGGWYYAFYHALADVAVRDWTTNLARSRDLIHWEKYPGNPIIGGNRSSAVLVPTPRGDRLYTMHPDVRMFEPAEE